MVLGVDPLTLAVVLALPVLPLLLILAALPHLRAIAAPPPARRRYASGAGMSRRR